MLGLLKEADYCETYDSISEERIRAQLLGCTECIHEWLLYSEDKRSDRGWYFQQQDGGGYIVGYFPSGSEPARHFSKGADACAFFIKHELEDIRHKSCSKRAEESKRKG